jgi:RES domain-containing protein
VIVWRLSRKRHLDQALEGEGARRFGGRWNSRGVAIAYSAESLELALLEALVHLDVDSLPKDYWQVCYEVDDALVGRPPKRLPTGWDALPPYQSRVQKIGDAWVKSGASLALRVPASVLPQRCNVLINPAHPDLSRVREVSRARLAWPRRLVEHLAAGSGLRSSRRGE